MNYKLAKKLKDNGFPQENKKEHCPGCYCDIQDPYIPTLSELIEACGDEFVCLEREDMEDDWTWKVVAYSDKERGFIYKTSKTPEEAVSKLWLELNK